MDSTIPTTRSPRRQRAPRLDFGSVAQLDSGRWRARFTGPDGARHAAPVTFATRAEARNYLTQVHAEMLRGHAVQLLPCTVTVGGYVRTWLEQATHLRPSTALLYRRTAARWILRRFGTVELDALPLDKLTPALVRTWHTELLTATAEAARTAAEAVPVTREHPARVWARSVGMDVKPTGRMSPRVLAAWQAAGSPTPERDRPIADATGPTPGRTAAVHAYRLLRTIVAQAVRDGLITHNPVDVKGASTTRPAERQPLTVAEVAALAEAVEPRYRAAVLVAAYSGLRPGELAALQRADVDPAAGTVTVRRTLVELETGPSFGPPKTSAGRRTVALPESIAAALAEHLDKYTPDDPAALVFADDDGDPLTKVRRTRVMGRARKAINRPDVSWHHLRHTGATLAAVSGATLAELQHRIGHSTPRAAMIYQHANTERDRAIASRLDGLITAAEPTGTPPVPPAPSVVPLAAVPAVPSGPVDDRQRPAGAPEPATAGTGSSTPGTAAEPAQAWAELLEHWATTCRAMGLDAERVAARCADVAEVLAVPLAHVHPSQVTGFQLTAALSTCRDADAYTAARTMLDALLRDFYQLTGRRGDPLINVPTSPPAHLAAREPAERPAPSPLPSSYTARRVGHLSVISATA